MKQLIRKILKEETEQYNTPVLTILKTLYPNFNKDNASIKKSSSQMGNDVILYDDPETGYPFCSYWIDDRELVLTRELFETFDSYLNMDTWTDDLLNWFNNEFNKDAEYVTF